MHLVNWITYKLMVNLFNFYAVHDAVWQKQKVNSQMNTSVLGLFESHWPSIPANQCEMFNFSFSPIFMSPQHISDNKHRKLIFTRVFCVSIRNSYIPPKNAQKYLRNVFKRITNNITPFSRSMRARRPDV